MWPLVCSSETKIIWTPIPWGFTHALEELLASREGPGDQAGVPAFNGRHGSSLAKKSWPTLSENRTLHPIQNGQKICRHALYGDMSTTYTLFTLKNPRILSLEKERWNTAKCKAKIITPMIIHRSISSRPDPHRLEQSDKATEVVPSLLARATASILEECDKVEKAFHSVSNFYLYHPASRRVLISPNNSCNIWIGC